MKSTYLISLEKKKQKKAKRVRVFWGLNVDLRVSKRAE